MDIAPGVSLGPYRILKPLGSGGMGAVYLAYDERLDRRVALKMMTHGVGDDAARQLRREARAIARLNHPNIAALYDVFEHDGEAFLVMEYVDGQPLSALVGSPPVSVDRALDIGLQLADALRYAHREGIVHRDVKPGNIMITREGTVKVLDLGLAHSQSTDPAAITRSASDTVIPARAGTPAYMSPERLSGRPADARADVYGAGVVLFELLTGRRPFSAPDVMTLAVSIATQPTPRVSSTRPDVPPMLDDLIARAMAKDPDTRYASAQELRDSLARVRDTLQGTVTGTTGSRPASTRRRVMIGALAITSVVAASWLVLRRTPAAAPPTTVAIPPVVNGSTKDSELDELATLLQSVLARNLPVLPGVTIARASSLTTDAPTRAPSQSPPAIGYTASLTARRMVASLTTDLDLRRSVDSQPVHQQFTGNELSLIGTTVNGVAIALLRSETPARSLTSAERRALGELPTRDGQALLSYLHGRVVLDTSDDDQTDNRAVAAFQAAIDRDRSFAFAQAGLSQAYSSLFKHTGDAIWKSRARDAATRALQIDPRCDQAHLALALAFRALQQKDEAVLEANQAVALTPDSDDAHRVLGLTVIDQGHVEAGLEELQTAVALSPRHWMTYYALGGRLLAAHRFSDAIERLKQVQEHLPDFESAYVNLGLAYMSIGNWDLAVGNLERARQLNSTDHYASNNLATAYYWDRQFKKALDLYQEAIRQDPENPKQFMNLGDAYEALGRKADARTAYAQAIALADARPAAEFDPAIEAIAAKCEAKLGIFDRAESRARTALARAEDSPEVVYKLAVVYALSGHPDKALDRLEQATKLGYSPVLFRDDPDLRSLAGQPRFKALVAGAVR